MNIKPANEDRERIQSVVENLLQGEILLTEISDDIYTRKVPFAFNASIGGHYRHRLDHFRTLIDAIPTGDLNYDHRERGTLIENDRYTALNATRALREGYEKLEPIFLQRLLRVLAANSSDWQWADKTAAKPTIEERLSKMKDTQAFTKRTIRRKTVELGILATLKAKPGNETEVEQFLKSALPLANQEADAVVWFALRLNANTFCNSREWLAVTVQDARARAESPVRARLMVGH